MASFIRCPHCGSRPKEEFTVKGAAVQRPPAGTSAQGWFDYVYIRQNPRSLLREFWLHAGGCRRWLIVTRDTATHDVEDVADAAAMRKAHCA